MEAIVFDIGQTLAYYPIPLNWSALYRPAFEHVADKLELTISEEEFEHIGATLRKYNTRINPREEEVSSDIIFNEIKSITNTAEADMKAYFNSKYPEDSTVLKGGESNGRQSSG